jgi:uncharacterized protein (DUF1501 family)
MMEFPSMSRRDWLISLSMTGLSASTWLRSFAAEASANPQRKKSVILLWLNGGPSTIDLWDLKPGSETGGPFREIETATAGIRISEHLPKLAQQMNDVAIVRSLSTKEGDHQRATHLLRTGYVPQAAIQFPALGSIVAQEHGQETIDLPPFVSIMPQRAVASLGGGFLGPACGPLVIGERATSVDELRVAELQAEASNRHLDNRLAVLNQLDERFRNNRSGAVIESLRTSTSRAVRLMRPSAAAAFQLEEERDELRAAYGRNLFGQGCLLARRLVERGVACVEVTLDGWDTHRDNFTQLKQLSGVLDGALATLIEDLRQRDLLDSTIVACHGEFGRTPKINANFGRDHWPQSWSAVVAGGGLRGGQTVGRTSDDGRSVEDRPVGVPDLIATLCQAAGIDHKKQNISNVSRPIRVADPTAQLIEELL